MSVRTLALVTKVAERCNLACDYCYMYEGLDDTWSSRPRFLSEAHQDRLVGRIGEFLAEAPDHQVVVELHGGEPLLWGHDRLDAFVSKLRALPDAARLDVALQTNGVLLDSAWLDLFRRRGVSWSISCDGPAAVHDRHRLFPDGRPSSVAVEHGLALSVQHDPDGELFGGVLAVADFESDPAAVLKHFWSRGVRSLDLLLPDASILTAGPQDADAAGRYLTRAFESWLALDDPRFSVRFLEEFVLGVLGRRSALDYLGGDMSGLVVVESDGTLQLLDVLRICGRDAAWTGMHLDTHSFGEFVARSIAELPAPAAQCRACQAFSACGGGYLPHRFDGRGFDNPSAYCSALLALHGRVVEELRPIFDRSRARRRRTGLPFAARA